jgi:hypothetical protein
VRASGIASLWCQTTALDLKTGVKSGQHESIPCQKPSHLPQGVVYARVLLKLNGVGSLTDVEPLHERPHLQKARQPPRHKVTRAEGHACVCEGRGSDREAAVASNGLACPLAWPRLRRDCQNATNVPGQFSSNPQNNLGQSLCPRTTTAAELWRPHHVRRRQLQLDLQQRSALTACNLQAPRAPGRQIQWKTTARLHQRLGQLVLGASASDMKVACDASRHTTQQSQL